MFNKINGYYLDSEQINIILDESKYLLVVAGAGSGKTLTILGKIGYLIHEKNINPNEILCISFTKKASESLEQKILKEFNIKVPVYTFHKLSLEILTQKNISYEIADSDTLENIIDQFFFDSILNYPYQMKIVLKLFSKRINKNFKKNYQKLLIDEKEKIISLEKSIAMFIHLFKCNNYNIIDFKTFFKKIKWSLSYNKDKKYLLLVLNIYIMYVNYLKENNEIDFDDMIIKATEEVKKDYNERLKYIIIDEYQDTSLIRFNLIKEILIRTQANLMVVGDDFQSIYRFTGCDLELFINFKKYFRNAKIMNINSTYRNSQQLIKIAGDFVMKNKNQIRKKLVSNKELDTPIQIIYYRNIKNTIKKLILEIAAKSKKEIMILGRNNKDINCILDTELKEENGRIIFINHEDIKLTYLTVHKSKGLESENVIIINLKNDALGFPSKIKEHKILKLVLKNREKYPYSEERRLFYVALTRTKNYVYLLAPKTNTSVFVKELINYHSKKIIVKK